MSHCELTLAREDVVNFSQRSLFWVLSDVDRVYLKLLLKDRENSNHFYKHVVSINLVLHATPSSASGGENEKNYWRV